MLVQFQFMIMTMCNAKTGDGKQVFVSFSDNGELSKQIRNAFDAQTIGSHSYIALLSTRNFR